MVYDVDGAGSRMILGGLGCALGWGGGFGKVGIVLDR